MVILDLTLSFKIISRLKLYYKMGYYIFSLDMEIEISAKLRRINKILFQTRKRQLTSVLDV